jgi:hypothetical protein
MRIILHISVLALVGFYSLEAQNIRVVNMTPNALSNETNQDSEPNLAVSPTDPLRIVGSAFTFNPTGATATAPVYISQDGGNTWVLNNIVPSLNGCTADITVGIGRRDTLYSGILTGGYVGPNDPQMQILRMANYLAAGTMTNLLTRTDDDQPYVEAIQPMGGAQRNNDHIYVGHNDFNAASNRTATVEQSLDAETAAAPANLTTERLEVRNPFNQDGPPIRTATHPRGTVYAMFIRRTNSVGVTRTGDVVVVRDDDWGQGATSFNNLVDPGDGLAGIRVATGINWTWNAGSAMGQERLMDRATIAVDPTDWQTVYIGYIDRAPGAGNNTTRLHIRRSVDGGSTWSADLLTVNNIIAPQLAVNVRGEVGVLYQQLTGAAPTQQWETRFRQSNDGGTTWSNIVLCQTPSNAPVRVFGPYLGDYAGLKAVGMNFYGVFSANNTPDNANFPNGIAYQRNANFGTNVLRNLANTANVAVSIDPFFFEVEQIADEHDFYLRDWTDNATTYDIGLEPSTHPVFYANSDVWNRRSNAAGGFDANHRPQSQNPQSSTLGTNFAFARVQRNGTGTAETVTLHFLKSEFGTGSNYVNADTAADPTLAFAAGEQVKTMSSGYEWTLTATTSSHTCLAVEISTPSDPVITPTLLGRTPGWPDTDLSVLYDNNKAQRNMGVYTESDGSGEGSATTYYAVIHNGATYIRDLILQFELSPGFRELFKRATLDFPAVRDHKPEVEGDNIIFKDMKPGENRWLGLTIPPSSHLEKARGLVGVEFTEVVHNVPINGFAIALQAGSAKECVLNNTRLYAEVLLRMGALFGWRDATDEGEKFLRRLVKTDSDEKEYLRYLEQHLETMARLTKQVVEKNRGEDPFQTTSAFGALEGSVKAQDLQRTIAAHRNYNHRMDAFLTMIDKQRGDVADILQTVLWQRDLYLAVEALRSLAKAHNLVEMTEDFSAKYRAAELAPYDYPDLVMQLFPLYYATSQRVSRPELIEDLKAMLDALQDQKLLQKAHADLLTNMEGLKASQPDSPPRK